MNVEMNMIIVGVIVMIMIIGVGLDSMIHHRSLRIAPLAGLLLLEAVSLLAIKGLAEVLPLALTGMFK